MSRVPKWLALLAALPDHAIPERKAVASPELIASGKADAIAGWHSIMIHLSAGDAGLRHVQLTVDADGKLLSAGDHVLLERKERRGDLIVTIYDQQSIGGRYADEGSFHGTRWATHTEQDNAHAGEEPEITSTPSEPSHEDIMALNVLVAEVLRRAPKSAS
jgi:hypothetical protein